MYRSIFRFIINDIMKKGVLPFDDLQYGVFAQNHGGFTAADMGFTIVNWRYDMIR